jgi:adenylate cyclase
MVKAPAWITAIRDVGVRDQDIATSRRLRTINVCAFLAASITFAYGLSYVVYDWWHFRYEIAFLLVASAAYPSVFLFTRRGQAGAGMWTLVLLAVAHLATIAWLLGPASGALNYLLITPFILSLLIREGDRVSVWPIALVVSGLFAFVTLGGNRGSVGSLPEEFQRALFIVNVFGAVLLASGIGLFFRWLIQKAESELEAERARSDRLLRAILPDPVAERLKSDDSDVVARRYPEATAVFADIVGFTRRSAEIDADRIVAELNRIYGRIDALAEARGIEKIKTIGDAYFAVAGVPEPVADHAERVADFALDLRAAARDWRSEIWPTLRFRTVIHAGPVVAGVIGRTKFAYDVWGDTINTAARLEEHCPPGEILISAAAAAALPLRFSTEDLGTLDLRDRGQIGVRRLVSAAPD